MWNTPPLLVGLQACTATLEISLEVLRKLDIVLPEDPAIPLLGIYPKYVPTCNKDKYSTMFMRSDLLILDIQHKLLVFCSGKFPLCLYV
jgi:hypothetical protein